MIVTNISNGLGNQMFQYAAARALSLRLNDPDLFLSTGEVDQDPLRHFELDAFDLPVRQLRWIDRLRMGVSYGNPKKPIRRLARAILPSLQLNVLREHDADFDPRLTTIQGDVYLFGYWQSYRYFDSVAESIRDDFRFKAPPSETNRLMLEQIKASRSVAIHIRRGDYAKVPQLTAKHGLCGLDYYQAAIARISGEVANPHFFVFSDDPAWTRANLQINAPATFVAHNTGRQSREDLRLMSACEHFIIANSTFSWWGAWLSRSENKRVIAPQQWFKSHTSTGSDLIPPQWVRL